MASAGDRGRGVGMASQTGGGQAPGQQGAGVSGLAGAAQEAARQVGSTAARTAEQAWDTAGRQARELASTAGDAWGDFRGFLGRYPVAVFFAGLGIGFLLARALDRWPDDMTRRMSEASYR